MILINKYKKHFKYLRILDGIVALQGSLLLEAEAQNGRYLVQVVDNNLESVEMQIEDWLSKREK